MISNVLKRRGHRHTRSAVAVVVTGGLVTTGLVLFSGTALAADTLGAAAAQSGRYFGAAIAPNLLGEADYASTPWSGTPSSPAGCRA